MRVRGISRRKFVALGVTAAAGVAATKAPGGVWSQPAAALKAAVAWKDQGVLELGSSPHAKLKGLPVRAVKIEDGFWSKRRAINVRASIPSMREELLGHGRMDNFLRVKGRSKEPQKGPVYSDSDIYKWIEAAGFAMQASDGSKPADPALRSTVDAMIRDVIAIQEPSGYIDTYYQDDRMKDRMTPVVQMRGHEMYCLGHMLQGAIAYYRGTGDDTLLKAAKRYVDDFVLTGFGPAADKQPMVSGHPEVEMGLIELYRTTGDKRYVDLAGYLLKGDVRIPLKQKDIVYMYCGVPFTSRTKLEGHAVRAMYACCGATDYYLETGDSMYMKTLEALWRDLSQAQMYVTGGVGARSEGEAFGDDYELPNARAYGESCAAIGNMMWNWRMLAATGEAKYADVIERALYNGINSGMSLDGKTYCYRNPLAFDPTTGDTIRNTWYDTTCCPPNIERTLASLPGYFYSTAKDGVYVHLYDNSEMEWKLESGTGLKMTQVTKYPWEGTVRLTVAAEKPEEFTVYVRIPGWSRRNGVKVAGQAVHGETGQGVKAGEYLAIKRRWSGETAIELSFDMEPQLVRANVAVADDTGRVAVQRGPLVYCMEGTDQLKGTDAKSFPLYMAKKNGAVGAKFEGGMLDGVMVLEHAGVKATEATSSLYSSAAGPAVKSAEPATLRLIPYYAWANREPSAMQVWIPVAEG